jgi:hypothetical protein
LECVLALHGQEVEVMIEEYKPTKEKGTKQTNSHHQPTIHLKPVTTTTTKGVPVHKVISLNFERIHWFQ